MSYYCRRQRRKPCSRRCPCRKKIKDTSQNLYAVGRADYETKSGEHHGGEYVELILTGDTYNQAGDAAKEYVRKHGYTYIHPFDDMYTMAGQAMIADEIIKDCGHAI